MWTCDNCKSEVDENFIRCWNCDSLKPGEIIVEEDDNPKTELTAQELYNECSSYVSTPVPRKKISMVALLSLFSPILGFIMSVIVWNSSGKNWGMMFYVAIIRIVASVVGLVFSAISLLFDKIGWKIVAVIGGSISIFFLYVLGAFK